MKLCFDFSNRANKLVTLNTEYVQKVYKDTEFYGFSGAAHVENLRSVYRLLEKKKVPNTDRLVQFNLVPKPFVRLQPVGNSQAPQNEKELIEAIICILEAVKVSLPLLFVSGAWL